MLRKILMGVTLFLLVSVVVACAGPASVPAPGPEPTPALPSPTSTPEPTPKPSGPITARWIEPQVDGDIISIALSEVEDNWNTHFKLDVQGSRINFMAYVLDGEIYVRANVCPPCKSIGFALDEDILVCARCGTTFEADTGDGIQGACVNYPKESVLYEIIDGKIVMNEADLIDSYQKTIKAG